MPTVDIASCFASFASTALYPRDTSCSEVGPAKVVEASKSQKAGLIAGLVAGFASLVMLLVMAVVLWKTRSKANNGIPVSQSGMRRIESVSTVRTAPTPGVITPRELRRSETLASTYSAGALIVSTNTVDASKKEKSDSL